MRDHSHNTPSQTRYLAMQKWLFQQLHCKPLIVPLANDASCRRYYRIHTNNRTFVLMDHPGNTHDTHEFCRLSKALTTGGLTVPVVHKKDTGQGFLLLTDFGDDLLFKLLTPQTATGLYKKAINNLIQLQRNTGSIITQHHFTAPLFQNGFDRFMTLYVPRFSRPLQPHENRTLNHTFKKLITLALSQPQVLTHRDYHSKNILLLKNQTIGTIDFQDTLMGPLTYDVMTLLYDHYLTWPYTEIQKWIPYYYACLQRERQTVPDLKQVTQWIDWLAIAHIIKNCGHFIFLDQKKERYFYQKYLINMHRQLLSVLQHYPELNDATQILTNMPPQERL